MLLRILGLCLLLPLLPLPRLCAQTLPSARDSAYAVHQLFRERRQRALTGASLGLAGLSGTVFAAAHRQPGTSAGILGATILFTVLDVRALSRYSESREELVVQRYEQGWPVPPAVRRRLKARHFRAAP